VDTSQHFCPNATCAYRGWVDWGNLCANGHPSGGPWRQFYCTACEGYFLETHGTPFHGKRVAPDLLVWEVGALAEGLGIRAVARVFEVDPNTVLAWLVEVAEHAAAFSQYFRLCRKVGFWRPNPKLSSRKINHLRVSTFLFSVICDRAQFCPGFSATGPFPAHCATFNQLGVRVPFLAISPFAKPHYVSHRVSDHASILALIERRFLRPDPDADDAASPTPHLTARDANADTLEDLFDFNHSPSRHAHVMPLQHVPAASPTDPGCSPSPGEVF